MHELAKLLLLLVYAAYFNSLIRQTTGQAYLAPANMGLVVGEEGDVVEYIEGHNPNMAPWFEELDRPARPRGFDEWPEQDPGKIDASPGDYLIPDKVRENRKRQKKRDKAHVHKNLRSGKESSDSTDLAGLSKESTDLGDQSSADTDLDEPINKGRNILRPDEPVDKDKIAGKEFIYSIIPRSSPTATIENQLGNQVDDQNLIDPFKPRPIPTGELSPVTATNNGRLPIIYITNTISLKQGTSTIITRSVPTKSILFSSCIFGCETITYARTLVTILPLRLPCSLISCPPCPSCVPSTVKISVCPFITTVTPKASTTLVNGPTITIVRSTVTRTACTLTKIISVKGEKCMVSTSAKQFAGGEASSSSLPGTIKTFTPTSTAKTTTPPSNSTPIMAKTKISSLAFEDPERYIPMDSQSESDEEVLVSEKIRYDKKGERNIPSPNEFGKYIRSDQVEWDVSRTNMREYAQSIFPITITKTVTTGGSGLVTITSTLLSMTRLEEDDDYNGDGGLPRQAKANHRGNGVCSTFVICNPTQFTCPAIQISKAPQLASIVQSIMDAQVLFGTGGVVNRERTPNGAFIDELETPEKKIVARPGPLGDGSELLGGLNAFAFGPEGIFARIFEENQNKNFTTADANLGKNNTVTVTVTSATTVSIFPVPTKGRAHRAGPSLAASSSGASTYPTSPGLLWISSIFLIAALQQIMLNGLI